MANQDFYNIDGVISEAIRTHTDISPKDWGEWKMFCCSLKVLGYDETTFVALSSGDEKASRKAWRDEKNPTRYVKDSDRAKAKIIALAKQAGMDLKPFLLSQYQNPGTRHTHRPTQPRTATAVALVATPPQEPKPEPFYIPSERITQEAQRVQETGLYKFLCRYFPSERVKAVLESYRVGGAEYTTAEGNRAVSFPMINRQGLCVDCKIFHINPDTGSRKGLFIFPPTPNHPNGLTSTFALAMMKDPDKPGERLSHRRGDWAYFGEHLLTDKSKTVAVVESEKTAIIASLVYPQFIWIATGSITNLNPERFKPLEGFKIRIFPDRDGVAKWREKAKELATLGYPMEIDTTVTRYPGEPKDDLADVVIRTLQGKQIKPVEEPKPENKIINHQEVESPGESTAEGLNTLCCGFTWGEFTPWRWRVPEPSKENPGEWEQWLINRMDWKNEQQNKCRTCTKSILQDGFIFRRCKDKITLEEAASQRVCRGFHPIEQQPK